MAVYNKRNQPSLESLLASQLVMSIAVAWEAFLTDLLITYVTLNPQPTIDSLKERIIRSTTDRFGSNAAKGIRFSFPRNLTKSHASGLTDPKGWNIPLNSAEALSHRANDLLAAQYAKKFSLNADDSNFIDLIICLRNFLSHRSSASRQELVKSIGSISGGSNSFLAGRFRDAENYLKFKANGTDTRAVLIVRRLVEIAQKL
jgi:hypothetical protein